MIITRKMAEEAAHVLRISLDIVDRTSLKIAYRACARATHPDHGGTAAAFAAVDHSKQVLEEWLAAKHAKPINVPHGDPCPHCKAVGSVFVQRAFRQLRVQCPACRGTGEMFVEQEKGDQH